MNPILLQKQLRDNSNDLQDFYADLKKWGDEMRSKDGSFSTHNNNNNNKLGTNAKMKIKKPKQINEETIVPVKKKTFATDYKAWDKFDVDAECEKIDRNVSSDNESELTDEIDENMRDKAYVEKENGNRFVKNKKWDQAIKCYTKAIDCFRFDPVFYANRALCYLKKNQMLEAEEDCTTSLKLDSAYVKAYQRRAAAREVLGKLEGAEFDLKKVLDFEPANKESLKALEELEKKIKLNNDNKPRKMSKFQSERNQTRSTSDNKLKEIDTSKASKSIWPSGGGDGLFLVKAINKAPHLQSKKPLTRIEIKENLIVNEIVETQEIKTKLDSKQSKNESNNELIDNNIDLVVPKTSVQFYMTWKQLKYLNNKYNYLKLIGPLRISGIFKESIDSNVFSEILEVLVNCYVANNDLVYEFLLCLTTIKRFSTIIVFFTEKDKSNLWKLVDFVKIHENKSKDEVEQLINRFEL